jgi:hypothetical protein
MNPSDTGEIVTCTMGIDELRSPEFIAEMEKELAALKGRPIDFSDIPESAPDALWIRTGPGNLLGRLMVEAEERELAGGPFDSIERLLPEMTSRVAAMKDNFLDLSDMPEMAPYALTLLTGHGPSLEPLMPAARKRESATA